MTPRLAEAIADVIYESHRSAETWFNVARFTLIIDRNIETFREEPSLDPKAVQQLSQLSHRQLKQALRLLRDRAAAGMVRRCHGDAHLGNIVLIDDKPVLFDAIEFDPVIATTDLLYDLAFPFRPEERQTVCSTNISKTLGQKAQALFGYCRCFYRYVPLSALMLFIRCKQSSADQNADEEVRSYFNLALQFLKPTHPSLVAIGGKSGTGKSVLARYASALIGAPPGPVVLRSDIIRKTLLGVNPLMAGEVATLQEDYDIGKLDWPLIDASDSPYGRLSEARPF